MSTPVSLLSIRSGRSVSRADVPRLSFDAFRRAVVAAPLQHARVASLFGIPGPDAAVELFAVLVNDREGSLRVGSTVLTADTFPSMTLDCPQVHLFERQIAEEWGVVPEGHPWLKPVRFIRSRRPGHDAWGRPDNEQPVAGVMDFYRVEGDEVHEVAVGPVHAGVIEPGHFRFQCHGEHVFHLEVSLGYDHRGVERAMLGGPSKRAIHLMETLAGDTSVGHAIAHCKILEALGGGRVPARAQALRGIALELERVANHTGGLGGLANDVGYQPTASFCGRLRGDFLNLTAQICGNRFGRGLVRPGGVGFDLDHDRVEQMQERLARGALDVKRSVELLWNTASVQARFEGTGIVSAEIAEAFGVVGVAARACGIERDVRHDHPSGIYRLVHIPVSVWSEGDVFARANVRALEIERSCVFISDQLAQLPEGATRRKCEAPRASQLCVSLVEGWRGEICHVAMTDESGRFSSYKVVDPSFHNWQGVAMALRGQEISDFPLINKSFDLSYCGHDL